MNGEAIDPVLARVSEKLGGLAELARRLGIKRQAIYQWKKIPAERAADIERLTGVPRHELRPDLWSPPPPSEAA